MSLLSIRDLCVDYRAGDRNVRAVDRFSLDIEAGDSLGIVGESGSGKSTLVLALLRLLPKNQAIIQGEALFEGQDLISMPEQTLNALRWQELSIVFQKAMNSFSPVHRVGYMMRDIYRLHCPGKSKEEGRARVEELLDMVGLPPRVYALYPHELSGGMMQRVNIALSLMFNPKLLILDEATTALDVVTQTQILEEIAALEKKLDITRVMVTHDISVIASSCKNVAVLYAGRCLETGAVEKVLLDPLHPYTKGLINSFPKHNTEEKEPLRSIPGSLPDLSDVPPGCVFAPRCELAQDRCVEEAVETILTADGRRVCCHHYGGERLAEQ
ncbi:MAG: ABC transporter ATP-binding protein [Clostridiales Family XIII bacterium]|jgi:peptide/nickel transport system ATP-binding protein|nr:ABC transporter ATP-binding protein [Clostridiales Family XIII bacterium]